MGSEIELSKQSEMFPELVEVTNTKKANSDGGFDRLNHRSTTNDLTLL